jgi:hypothetical protein
MYNYPLTTTSCSWDLKVKDAGTCVGGYVKAERSASKRYAFSSCLRSISLICRAKTLAKTDAVTSAREVWL